MKRSTRPIQHRIIIIVYVNIMYVYIATYIYAICHGLLHIVYGKVEGTQQA